MRKLVLNSPLHGFSTHYDQRGNILGYDEFDLEAGAVIEVDCTDKVEKIDSGLLITFSGVDVLFIPEDIVEIREE